MKQRSQDFALGLTVIVVLGLFLGTIIFLYPLFHARGWELEIHFSHEHGMAPLKSGSAVILGGSMEVGRVREVRVEREVTYSLDGQEEHTVFVVMAEVNKDVKLHGNCQITTDQPAIGGNGFVSILNVGTPDVPLTGPIQGLPPQSLAAAIGTLSRRLLSEGGLIDNLDQALDPSVEGSVLHKVLVSLDDLNAMTRELRAQMSPEEQEALFGKFHLILDDLNATTSALRNEMAADKDAALLAKVHIALDRLSQGLEEATAMLKEDRPLILDTLVSVRNAAQTVDRELLAALRTELDAANPSSLMAQLHLAMGRVNASLEDLNAMTSASERMIVLSKPTLEKTLGNFEEMSEQMRLASQEVLLNPSKLIWGPGRQREEHLLVFQAARNFAEAASQLDDAAGRLEAVLKTLPPDGQATAADSEELKSIHEAVRAAFQRFERAEEVLWDKLK
ncbi:MAG: hypothetical protein KAY37_17660 [Phycisphaerae bacterium]|nr:hypothetical protein [Phycisphaerae bacterium]